MAQSVEHRTAAQTVPGSSLGHYLLFGRNPGQSVSWKRFEKKNIYACVTTLDRASVKTERLWNE